MARDHIRSARFTAGEIERIERAAKGAGMTLSAYLRHAALRLARPAAPITWVSGEPTTTTLGTWANVIWEEAG